MNLTSQNKQLSKTKHLIVFLIITFFISSCMSLKPGSSKSGKKYYQTFYVGDKGNQYFIKPMEFENKKLKNELFMDFTIRYKDDINTTTTLNYSAKIEDIIREVDSLVISNSIHSVKQTQNDLLFNAREDDKFESRFSTEIILKELKLIFNDPNWKVELYANSKKYSFTPKRKTSKKIITLYNNVFVLFE
ncbi:hypothetical protein CW751_05635 [Brumimicrobium salinarum]|uniref:Uncharacterized protein n=1 Tax=Brumimicrobium salinarum TaxID=2058658 RepID=A0A2I0R3C6_9FLAO|nr:hypothetical protein [Brumimicrobium salinarum]PKR81065.1 hypothetical protein CW751_05635 [Brumimicrobium salinarum]